jgi:uncharacterized protein YPO0396
MSIQASQITDMPAEPAAEPAALPAALSAADSTRLRQEAVEQFKLIRIQSFNWGTFDGLLKIDVSEKGMLFIGPSGSGKSTIFDSHASLLTPPRWLHYNVAARESESRQDRSALTYLRGVWGEQTAETGEIAAQQLRTGPTWAAISEVYRNILGTVVTLLHVYWIKGSSNQNRDVHKRFLVADRLLDLSELGFFPESGFNARRFKTDLPDVWDTDTFSDYQERMRSKLGISTEGALKLLHKTQSAKNLGSLTDFLRDFMLDEPETRKMANDLVDQFEHLENAHNEVITAAKQIATLAPARAANQERQAKLFVRNEIEEVRAGVENARVEMLRDLRQARQLQLETDLQAQQSLHELSIRTRDDARASFERLKEQRQGMGGEILANLEAAKASAEGESAERLQRHTKAQVACNAIGVTMPSGPTKYAELASQARRELTASISGDSAQATLRDQLVVQQHELKTEKDQIERDLATLARMPRSRIGTDLIDIREQMASTLGIDEAAIPFAGELIEVMPAEKGWQGAIERVLKGFGRTLLVPEDLYPSVSRYVSTTHLRGRLVYLRMLPQTSRGSSKPGGVSSKVQVTDGPFKSWVEEELTQNFDAVCVEAPEELRGVAFGVTRSGLVKSGTRRHEKDDRTEVNNPRFWVLGADTRSKAVALQDRHEALVQKLSSVDAEIKQIEEKERKRLLRALSWQSIVDLTWQDIDHVSASQRVAALADEIAAFRAASPDLDVLQGRINKAEDILKTAEDRLSEQTERVTRVKVKLDANADAMEMDAKLASVSPTPLQRTAIAKRLKDAERDPTVESLSEDMRVVDRKLGADLNTLDRELSLLVQKIEKQFVEFNFHWGPQSGGLDPTMASYDEYDAKLSRLVTDDLPRFEAKFKELLNQHSNQHIALLSNQIEQERRDISDRMETVTASLRRAEYNKGTHLIIEVEDHTPTPASELKAALRAALTNTLSVDDKETEARFQSMKRLIKRLASQKPEDENWKRLALDVRLHVEFIARELDENGDEVQVHRSGAGKSGGQRQKLTATCLAAALRYQLGGAGRTLPMFSTIFLDEAFDKADADFTDAAMRIFKSFGFQLIIATPIKSVMTIEPYVGGAVFIHIKDRKHSRALVLPYDDEVQRIDFRPVDGSSANDEKP